jgi:peptide/nickel transport system permease protein
LKFVLIQKLIRYGLALFFVLSLNFFIPRLMPGNPVLAIIGEGSYLSREDLSALERTYGLDQPLMKQFGAYLKRSMAFDFGNSIHRFTPVRRLVFSALSRTLIVSFPALAAGSLLGIFLGSLAGWRPGNFWGNCALGGGLFLYSLPPYFLAILILYIFAVKLPIFPLPGSGRAGSNLILPFMTLSLFSFARHFLMMRGSIGAERKKIYPVFACSKGLSSRQILFRHGFKNALLPVITLLAMDLGFLLGGALFVEIVFSINGIGLLLYNALLGRDYPLIQGIFFLLMVSVLILNSLADLVCLAVDPRTREKG